MKKLIKSILLKAIGYFTSVLKKNKVGRYVLEQLLSQAMNTVEAVNYKNNKLNFVVPNGLNHFRIKSFATKEPETLAWIDGIEKNAILWDIGANIGLYSCYAAQARNCKVYAFEPSVFNLELLSRNIFINQLVDQITILPIALSDGTKTANLKMTTTEWGGALSTFEQGYTHDGSQIKKIFEFKTLGLSMNDAVALLKLPQPDYIKMDVDGIEHLILKGGHEVLKVVKGVIIEINEEFQKQSADSSQYLKDAGLTMIDKKHSDMFDGTICYNQIWSRI